MQFDPKKVDLRVSKGKEKEDEGLKLYLPATKRPFNAILYGDMVQKGFAHLYGDTKISDVTLVLGDDAEKIPVHRIVLRVWSEAFRTLLENVAKNADVPIALDKEDVEHFKLMLKHMYTGDTDFVNGDNVLALLSLASHFGIHSLKETCGELLGELVTDDNLFFFLDVVDKYEVKALESACGSHLAEHFQDLVNNGKLDDLEPSTWAEIVKTDDIRVKSEEELFEAVIRYAGKFKQKEAREHALTTILPFVRFPFMSPRFLVTKVEGDESIASLPLVQDLLHEAYRFRVNPSSVKNIRSQPRKGYRFEDEQCHPSITLSEDKLKATVKGSVGWVNVRCMTPLSRESPYIEFKVENGTAGQLMLGVVAGTCSTSGYAGQYNNGWTYYSSGQVYNSSSTPATGQAYGNGDTVGVFVEFDKNTLHFFKNGKSSTSTPVSIGTQQLYPSVSMSTLGNCVSLVPYAPLPDEAKAKIKPATDKAGAGAGTPARKKRTKLTSSSLGRTYGEDDTMVAALTEEEEAAEAIDGATFIKRFLRFKF